MKPCIRIARLWDDDGMASLRVEACDGIASFVNQIYVAHHDLRSMVSGLLVFKEQVHGGTFDLRLGCFGPGYRSSAFDAQLQFRARGRIFVRVSARSETRRFEDREFASEAVLYLMTEPALLDAFIAGLQAMADGRGDEATLGTTHYDYST